MGRAVRVNLSGGGGKLEGVMGGMGGGFERLERGPTSWQESLNERAI